MILLDLVHSYVGHPYDEFWNGKNGNAIPIPMGYGFWVGASLCLLQIFICFEIILHYAY